jgi:hypothetical protein
VPPVETVPVLLHVGRVLRCAATDTRVFTRGGGRAAWL